MSTGSTSFTTSHRVIVRVHDNTTVVGALAKMATAAGLAVRLEVVVRVGHGTYGSAAAYENHTGLAGGQTQDCVVAFAGCELGAGAGAACHCGTLAGTELDVVHEGTDGDFTQRQAVADLGSDTAAGGHDLADLDSVGSDDITLLAILILDQGDAGAAVRIILDGHNGCGALVFVAEEVDDAVHPLVAAADVTYGHLTGVVAAAGALKGFEQ